MSRHWQSTTDATRCSFSVYVNGTHQHDEILAKETGKTSKEETIKAFVLASGPGSPPSKLCDYISEV